MCIGELGMGDPQGIVQKHDTVYFFRPSTFTPLTSYRGNYYSYFMLLDPFWL